MTITGKCDVCRVRKVKCDERKPKCGACQKRDRACSYSYGKVTAFVAEEPMQLSKHGKPMGAPITYPVVTWEDLDPGYFSASSPSNSSSSEKLLLTAKKDADDGKGIFLTLAVPSEHKRRGIRKPTAWQKKRLENHLNRLRESSELTSHRLSSPESALVARYLNMLGSRSLKDHPLAILGSFIESIPSRLGSSLVVDLAVEYLADSFTVYRGNTFSNRSVALTSKAKALRQLQLVISDDQTRATYDTVLAMKMLFIAEIFMGIKTLQHAIHTIGLVEILRAGPVTGFDADHYWNFVDNTYLDDVMEAMISGRTSVFDNDFYLETSSPAAIQADAPAAFRASVTNMHIFIQLPRLICLVRHAREHPQDTETLAAAVCLAESLWILVPNDIMEQVLQSSTAVIPIPPAPEIADIVPDSLHFDSIANSVLISRYWMLKICLSGLIENLYLNFPEYTANSLLPNLVTVQQTDIDAATNLARCVQYALYTCPSFPILPLRIHTTFQLSLGAWRRLYLRLGRAQEALNHTLSIQEDIGLTAQIDRAARMEQFVTDECSRLHKVWGLERVSTEFYHAAVEDMAGGPIPDWLPTSVKFEEEGGEMVMKVECGISEPRIAMLLGEDDEERVSWKRCSTTASPFGKKRPMKAVPVSPKRHLRPNFCVSASSVGG